MPPEPWHGGKVVVLVQVELDTLVELELDVDVLLVVGTTQPPFWQASQQLESAPAHALPPLGALQAAAFFLIEHLVTPLRLVRQQVTKPGRPHVERAAQRCTCPTQPWFTRVARAWPAAQLT